MVGRLSCRIVSDPHRPLSFAPGKVGIPEGLPGCSRAAGRDEHSPGAMSELVEEGADANRLPERGGEVGFLSRPLLSLFL